MSFPRKLMSHEHLSAERARYYTIAADLQALQPRLLALG